MDVISIGSPLIQDLRDSRVIARYDSTLQLETRDRALWAITTRPNPGARRVVVPIVPSWDVGARVRVRGEKIFGDGCELVWNASAQFEPVPRRRTLSADQRASAARTIADSLAREEVPDALGFWNELGKVWAPLANAIASDAKQSLKTQANDFFAVTNVLCNNTLDGLVRGLIGCGPGLTPSGDDFLQALLITLSSGDAQDRAAFQSLASAVKPHLPRTTRVSRAFLVEAMQGWAFGALKDVLDGLPMVTQDKIDALLGIGATSGPAYALGILMGLSWSTRANGTQ